MSSTRITEELIPLLRREYLGFDGRLGRVAHVRRKIGYLGLPIGDIKTFPIWKINQDYDYEDDDEDEDDDLVLGPTLERFVPEIQTMIEKKEYVLDEMDDRAGRSPLHLIFTLHSPGQVEVIKAMLSAKSVKVNVMDCNQRTPLHHLLSPHNAQHYEKRNEDMAALIRLLLDSGANVNAQDDHLVTPLHLAVQNGQQSVALMLLNSGANVNSKDDQFVTPLHLALQYGQLQLAKTFLELGADCTAADTNRKTPLHLACRLNPSKELDEIIQILIKNGANVNAREELAMTPLHFVCSEGCYRVPRLMLDMGADMPSHDNTALHEMTKSYKRGLKKNTCVQVLIDAGANLAAKDSRGCTPLLMLGPSSPYKLIIAHVALRVSAGKYALSKREREFLDSFDIFAKFYADCSSCVPAMKTQTLGDSSVTLWCFLLAPQRQARLYTRNPLILEDLHICRNRPEFLPYSQNIDERILDCGYFHQLHQQAYSFVKSLLSKDLPTVFEKIISNLNDFDLKALASAANPNQTVA